MSVELTLVVSRAEFIGGQDRFRLTGHKRNSVSTAAEHQLEVQHCWAMAKAAASPADKAAWLILASAWFGLVRETDLAVRQNSIPNHGEQRPKSNPENSINFCQFSLIDRAARPLQPKRIGFFSLRR